jgi:coproporphyrinogen III oxidase-like Fe-S oxidoreductase
MCRARPWTKAVTTKGAAPAYTETLDPADRLGETWWLGLRLATGVHPAEAMATAGWEGPDPTLPIRKKLESQGLLESHQGRLRIPNSALAIADHIGKQFLCPGS